MTPRLVLIPASIAVIQAVLDEQYELAGALEGVTVPRDWPGNADALAALPIHLAAMRRDLEQLPWRFRLIVRLRDRLVIGSIDLKGTPREGVVEIGWGLIESARRSGYAREAAKAVVDWLATRREVQRITAAIAPTNLASINIAEHLGMAMTSTLYRGLPVYSVLASARGAAKR